MHIFNDNDSVNDFNLNIVKTSPELVVELKANNTSKKGRNANDQLFNGLLNSILISLTSNLWTKNGSRYSKINYLPR